MRVLCDPTSRNHTAARPPAYSLCLGSLASPVPLASLWAVCRHDESYMDAPCISTSAPDPTSHIHTAARLLARSPPRSRLCAATMTLGARLYIQFDSAPCAWITGGFAVVTVVANEWVQRVYVPNTRQTPVPADDDKIMAWSEGIKELSKEAQLKLETDAANVAKAEAEVRGIAAWTCCLYVACMSLVCRLCVACVSLVCRLYVACVSLVCRLCVACVSLVCRLFVAGPSCDPQRHSFAPHMRTCAHAQATAGGVVAPGSPPACSQVRGGVFSLSCAVRTCVWARVSVCVELRVG